MPLSFLFLECNRLWPNLATELTPKSLLFAAKLVLNLQIYNLSWRAWSNPVRRL